MLGVLAILQCPKAVNTSLPQIGDTHPTFYTVDVGHTQTHSAGVCGSGWIAFERVPPQASSRPPNLARGKAPMLIIVAFTTACSILGVLTLVVLEW